MCLRVIKIASSAGIKPIMIRFMTEFDTKLILRRWGDERERDAGGGLMTNLMTRKPVHVPYILC